jgi:hypothetical protein
MGTLPKNSTKGKQLVRRPEDEPGCTRATDILKAGTGHGGVIAGIVLGAGAAGTGDVVASVGVAAVCVIAALSAFLAHRCRH